MADTGDQIDRDFQIVFGTDEGERVLRFLMGGACIWGETSFDVDPLKMAYNEGRRSVILQILDRVHRDVTVLEFADEQIQAQHDYADTRPAVDPSAAGSGV